MELISIFTLLSAAWWLSGILCNQFWATFNRSLSEHPRGRNFSKTWANRNTAKPVQSTPSCSLVQRRTSCIKGEASQYVALITCKYIYPCEAAPCSKYGLSFLISLFIMEIWSWAAWLTLRKQRFHIKNKTQPHHFKQSKAFDIFSIINLCD